MGFDMVALLNPMAGVQIYELAPVAFKFAEAPEQIVFEDTFAEMIGYGCTVTLAVFVQPFRVPVTV